MKSCLKSSPVLRREFRRIILLQPILAAEHLKTEKLTGICHQQKSGIWFGRLQFRIRALSVISVIESVFSGKQQKFRFPIMIYNNWWNTINMNVDMVERLVELPNVVALKWSAPSSLQLTEGLQRFADRLAIIDNSGEFVWCHMMGAVGLITHLGNFWPEYPLTLWDLLEQRKYEAVIDKLAEFKWPWRKWVHKVIQETEGEGPFIKAAMEIVGLQAGPPRRPARPVSRELREELERLFAKVGVPKVSA